MTDIYKIHRYLSIILLSLLIFTLSSNYLMAEEFLKEPVWVYYGRGNRYFHEKKYGYALAEYKKAIIKINKTSKKSGTFNSYYPDINLKIAEINFIEKLYEEALYFLDISYKNSELFQIPDRIYDVLYLKARCFEKLEKMDRAIEEYINIIKRDDNWKVYKKLAIVDIPEMINSPEKRKKFGKAYYQLGVIKYNNKNYENAIAYLKMAFLYRYKLEETVKILRDCYSILGYNFVIEKINKMIKP